MQQGQVPNPEPRDCKRGPAWLGSQAPLLSSAEGKTRGGGSHPRDGSPGSAVGRPFPAVCRWVNECTGPHEGDQRRRRQLCCRYRCDEAVVPVALVTSTVPVPEWAQASFLQVPSHTPHGRPGPGLLKGAVAALGPLSFLPVPPPPFPGESPAGPPRRAPSQVP